MDLRLFIDNISNVIIVGEQLEMEATAQYDGSKQASYLCTLTKVRLYNACNTILTLLSIG